ncbi:hypothetical protein L6452_34798 [Arctium lappa]|uniref:Uncharacterized protein n=1 Tax=Arctium lappa TaxID=4217 RepID=A0ACB8YJ87_ARCLA|nr:hypothetical protein L6452_34798 [Arctium lappa]
MGCGGSKVDDLPLVMRCRQRKEMIKSAMDYRYDLSSSHLAYFHSLKDIGYALSRFIDEQVVIPSSYTSSPVLTLPSDESHLHSINGNEDSHLHLSSDSESNLGSSSGGHIHIHDDSDDYDASVPGNKSKPSLSSFYPSYNHNQTNWDDPFVMNGGPTPSQHHEGTNQTNQSPADPAFGSAWGPYGGIFDSYDGYRENRNFYYMKKSAPASRTVIHQEARGFQETGQWPDPSDYNSFESGGFFGLSMSGSSAPEEPNQHNSAKAPSPPPPPKVSGWDFLNFFDGYDNGYQSHGYGFGSVVSSPDTVELREREGIPDLEEETENESHSEGVHMGKKLDTKRNIGKDTTRFFPEENTEVSLSRGRSQSNGGSSKRVPPGNIEGPSKEENDEGTSCSVPLQNDEGSHSVNVEVDMSMPETVSESVGEQNGSKREVSFDVDEGSIHEVESSRLSSLTTLSAHGSRDVQEVFNEIKDEFDIAFGYGKEVAVMLEAGKVPYRPRFAVLKGEGKLIFVALISCYVTLRFLMNCSDCDYIYLRILTI